jgi:very-short-patch-repair endonuclease
VNREPTTQEIEEKLIEMAYIWGDIEERLERDGDESAEGPLADVAQAGFLLREAFRVEAVMTRNGFDDPCSSYLVLFDVADPKARKTVARLADGILDHHILSPYILEHARPWHSNDHLEIKLVPRSQPVEGQICRRRGEQHPAKVNPSLDDVPTFVPSGSTVPLVQRGPYHLTPIEAAFYDALAETGLTFSVQPWFQQADKRYRNDFLVFYDGGVVAVELDGHEFHKTKEQRGHDAARDNWLAKRAIRVVRFTGTQVTADVNACIAELLDVVRQSQART